MTKQEKFITSHRSRVKRANAYVSGQREKINIFDREAIVEFYLLEDIVRLYEYRLDVEEGKSVTTRAGQMTKERNILKFKAILNVFNSAIEIAWGQITSGNYKTVWKAIPEHQLATAANNVKNLPMLRNLAVEMLKDLSNECMSAGNEVGALEEALDEIEDHEANTRTVKYLPSAEEINQIIDEAIKAIPDPKNKRRPRSNDNL